MPTLDWIGKAAVIDHDCAAPCRPLLVDEALSAGDPDSGNLLIEGDNLEALKALLPAYADKVKCVAIDPPYNTGFEGWSYDDNASHDEWLCMIYPRLKLLRELLREDGFIAVSIDDNELAHLDLVMAEIFGAGNRIACAPWKAEPSGGKQKGFIRTGHEYLLLYAKSAALSLALEEKPVDGRAFTDRWGPYVKGREYLKWGAHSERNDRPDMWYRLTAPDGSQVWPIRNDGKEGRWRIGARHVNAIKALADPEWMHWEMRPYDKGVSLDGQQRRWVPYEKIRAERKAFGWRSWLDHVGTNADGTAELKAIFGAKVFDTPKPTSLIRWILNLCPERDAIILDSFAGSGTSGHAVLDLNKADGGARRFILVETRPEIAAERLRRVIAGYPRRAGKPGDIPPAGGGFRYCRLGELLAEAGAIGASAGVEDMVCSPAK
jgi:adenine-specific DNA-methyltransferase